MPLSCSLIFLNQSLDRNFSALEDLNHRCYCPKSYGWSARSNYDSVSYKQMKRSKKILSVSLDKQSNQT